jgi:uncharacterized protein YbjT (DUF2867 family)
MRRVSERRIIMTSQLVLVTGATGDTGDTAGDAIDALAKLDISVRAMVRRDDERRRERAGWRWTAIPARM